MTPAEAAATLGTNEHSVRTLIRRGRLRATRVGGRWLITEDAVSEYARSRRNQPLAVRFESKVIRTEGGCWEWAGSHSPQGYAFMYVRPGVRTNAHRVAYELLVGPIPEGLDLDHLCRNRGCVNPAHLEPVTGGENNRRGISVAAVNATKERCPKGHPYDVTRTVRGRPARFCSTCERDRTARRAAERQRLRAHSG